MNRYILYLLYLPWRLFIIFAMTFYFLLYLLFQAVMPTKSRSSIPVILKQYLEKTGGTFVKTGQILAMRPDFLPIEYCEALSSLFDEVKPFRSSKGLKIIEKELQKPINKLFRYIAPKPIASASFGQVYKAEDWQGNSLAIKVMRPGIEYIVFADIFFLKVINLFLSVLHIAPRLGTNHLIAEIVEILKEELDYSIEARSIRLSWKASKKIPYMRVPRLYSQYSTRKVLAMEFLEGIWMKDILSEIRKNGIENLYDTTGKQIDTVRLSRRIFNIGMQQVFEHGFFHADPHAGNILIMANNEIGYIDFGIMGRIPREFRRKQIGYFKGIVSDDIEGALDAFTNMLIPHANADFEGFKRKLMPILQIWIYSNGDPGSKRSEKSTALLLMQSIDLARQHHFHLPFNTIRYYRSLVTIEPILAELNPSYDVKTALRRYIMRLSMIEFNKMIQYENVVERNLKAFRLFMYAPDFLGEIFDYVNTVMTSPMAIQKEVKKIFRFFSEFSFFLAIITLLIRIFFKVKNVGLLFGLPYKIDYRFVVIIFLYIGYRMYQSGYSVKKRL